MFINPTTGEVPKAGGTTDERPPPPPDVPPLTPDSTETNPDFIRAEMSFYTTPHTEEYRNGVYGALKAIQTQCLNDFNTFCPASTLDPTSGKPFLFLQHELHTAKSVSGQFRETKPRNLRNRRLTNSNHRDDHSPDRRGPSDGDEPPRPDDKDGHEDHHRPDDHGDDRHHHGGPRGPPPHHHVDEDTLFTGALGYGSIGDTCMNFNFEKLSADCQSPISELRTMRKSFWREDNWAARGANHRHRHDDDFFWPSYLALIAILMACRYSYKLRTMRVIKAIKANPALLAQVEAETGETLAKLDKKNFFSCLLGLLGIFFFVIFVNSLLFSAVMCLYPDLPPVPLAPGIFGCIILAMFLRAILRSILWTRASRANEPCQAQPVALTPINSIEAPLVTAGNSNDDPPGGSETKSSAPVTSFSTTTTTVTSTSVTSGSGILAAIRSAIGGLTGQSSADGGYSALSPEGSVHGRGVVVTGVPVAARREDGSNWN